MENPEKPDRSASKGKAILGLVISILFVLLGFFLLSEQMAEQSELPPMLIKGMGIFSIIVFGLIGLLHLKRLLRKD